MVRFAVVLAVMIWINTLAPLAGDPAGGSRGVHFAAAESQQTSNTSAARGRTATEGGALPGSCLGALKPQHTPLGTLRDLPQGVRTPEHLQLLTAVIHGSKYKTAGILCVYTT